MRTGDLDVKGLTCRQCFSRSGSTMEKHNQSASFSGNDVVLFRLLNRYRSPVDFSFVNDNQALDQVFGSPWEHQPLK